MKCVPKSLGADDHTTPHHTTSPHHTTPHTSHRTPHHTIPYHTTTPHRTDPNHTIPPYHTTISYHTRSQQKGHRGTEVPLFKDASVPKPFFFFRHVTPKQMHMLKFLFLVFKILTAPGGAQRFPVVHMGPLAIVKLSKEKTKEDFKRAIMNDASSGSHG